MRRPSVHPRSSTLGEMPRPISPRLHALRAAPPPQGLGAWRSALRCRCASDSSPARHAPAPGRSGSACTHHASTLIHAKAVDSAGGCKGGRRRKAAGGGGRPGQTHLSLPHARRVNVMRHCRTARIGTSLLCQLAVAIRVPCGGQHTHAAAAACWLRHRPAAGDCKGLGRHGCHGVGRVRVAYLRASWAR